MEGRVTKVIEWIPNGAEISPGGLKAASSLIDPFIIKQRSAGGSDDNVSTTVPGWQWWQAIVHLSLHKARERETEREWAKERSSRKSVRVYVTEAKLSAKNTTVTLSESHVITGASWTDPGCFTGRGRCSLSQLRAVVNAFKLQIKYSTGRRTGNCWPQARKLNIL